MSASGQKPLGKAIAAPNTLSESNDSSDSEGKPDTKEISSQESETVVPPSQIAGSSLVCQESADSISGVADPTVLCALQNGNGLVDLDAEFGSHTWSVIGNTDVVVTPLAPASGMHVSIVLGGEWDAQREFTFVFSAKAHDGTDHRFERALLVAENPAEPAVPLTAPVANPAPVPAPTPAPAPAPSPSSIFSNLENSRNQQSPSSTSTGFTCANVVNGQTNNENISCGNN